MYYLFIKRAMLAPAFLYLASCGGILSQASEDTSTNALIALAALAGSSCASYSEPVISNSLFSGGTRTLYNVSGCDTAGWSRIGFTSDGTTQVSDASKVVTDSSYSGFGTNIEVTFTVTSASGTLDVMTYGTGTFPGTSTTNPTVRIVAGSSCSAQARHSGTGALNNMSTCTDTTTLAAGATYTYCIDFNRGTGSSGSYTGFGNMLAIWSRACDQVASSERDQMADVKLMQMMNIPTMNPNNSGKVGFSSNGISLKSFKIGNTIYSSMM